MSGRRPVDTHYKWIALSNTTLGLLMATINSSIVLIALPDIFRGIGIDPLGPGNTRSLLWMIMGFLVVTAVLVVGFGRLGDMYGRVRLYNLGFVVFTVASIALSLDPWHAAAGAWGLIGSRGGRGLAVPASGWCSGASWPSGTGGPCSGSACRSGSPAPSGRTCRCTSSAS